MNLSDNKKPTPSSKSRGEEVIKRYDTQMGERSTLHSQWQDLAELCAPNVYNITTETTTGDRKTDYIFDYTAVEAISVWKGGLQNGIVPTDTPFFEFNTGIPELDEHPDVKNWLQESRSTVLDTLARSNFYNQTPSSFEHEGVFGISIIYAESDEETDVRFKTIKPSNAAVFLNRVNRPVGCIYKYTITLENLAEQFGLNNLSPSLQNKMKNDKDCKITMLHSVMRRTNRDISKEANPKHMPFESLHIEYESKNVVRESGYMNFPFAITILDYSEENPYGFSPAMKAEPEINAVNSIQALLNDSMELQVAPTVCMPSSAEIDFRIGPRQVNFFSGDSLEMVKYPTGDVPEYGLTLLQGKQRNIESVFYVDVFRSIRELDPNVTRTAIVQYKTERLQLLRPIIAVNRDSKVTPLVNFTYITLANKGKIKNAPKILEDYIKENKLKDPINVNLTSPLFRIQAEAQNLDAINTHMGVALNLAQANPEILDNYNFDAVPTIIQEAVDGPAKLLRSRDEVASIRKQRAEAQKQQSELQMQIMNAGIQNAQKEGQ